VQCIGVIVCPQNQTAEKETDRDRSDIRGFEQNYLRQKTVPGPNPDEQVGGRPHQVHNGEEQGDGALEECQELA
jgi:hypothetical protein